MLRQSSLVGGWGVVRGVVARCGTARAPASLLRGLDVGWGGVLPLCRRGGWGCGGSGCGFVFQVINHLGVELRAARAVAVAPMTVAAVYPGGRCGLDDRGCDGPGGCCGPMTVAAMDPDGCCGPDDRGYDGPGW